MPTPTVSYARQLVESAILIDEDLVQETLALLNEDASPAYVEKVVEIFERAQKVCEEGVEQMSEEEVKNLYEEMQHIRKSSLRTAKEKAEAEEQQALEKEFSTLLP
jgi:2-oxo-4-hydroxy-4-carboxy--5-ureidoimidazoline (OHCU) decarboxylase